MVDLISFVLVCFGMTQIIVYGTIFENIRPEEGILGKLFNCPMCIGFWAGVFLWGINDYTELFTFDLSIATGLLLGCLGSGTSYGLNALVDSFGFD